MLQSQRSAYRLQERLNQISTDEYCELLKAEESFDALDYGSSAEYQENHRRFRDKAIEIRNYFSMERKRAIWWAAHGNDIVALIVVICLVVLGFWLFFF